MLGAVVAAKIGGVHADAATNPAPVTKATGVKAVPYTWRNVKIVAGGFVDGILFHPAQRGLIYARTDMGGAYRWDIREKRWIPLTDWASQSDWNLRGIESIGLDPSDPNRVYLAAGTYTNNWAGNGSILRSRDKGRTFQRTEMPFKMGGNEDGRSAGERLAVDPHSGNILFFGSRHNGLWRSDDFGATWRSVSGFPVSGDTPDHVGTVFIVFDPVGGAVGSRTMHLIAGVSSGEAPLYESEDGGVHWQPLAGAPTGLSPHQAKIAADGRTLYITFANTPGPNGMSAGSVAKYDLRNRTWTDISPLPNGGGGGFAGLAVGGTRQPGLVMVSTMDHWGGGGDNLFRSIDGGRTWKPLREKSQRDASLSPYLNWGEAEPKFGWWIGALSLDPFDPEHAMYGTGATIWETHDAGAADRSAATHWAVGANGLEETAVIDLISPSVGAHLISGLGDIGGFRHDDLSVSPSGGMLQNPLLDNTDSLDYAEQNPSFIVRVGRGHTAHGGYSADSGKTWSPFATEPMGSHGSGSVAVSADGRTILWSPNNTVAARSDDRGATWSQCTGLPQGTRPVADRRNANVFYAYDTASGTLYVSTDQGRNFSAREHGILPTAGNGVQLRCSPDAEGDLWLAMGSKLLHSTDGGIRFTQLPGVDKAASLGFGKGAPGRSNSAIYLIGQIGRQEGFFRSDDSGKTWLRINDDQHQYGLVGPIIGDPRIYGRVYLGTNGRGILYADPSRL